MSGSGRKLNALEQKLHQAALSHPKKTLVQKEVDAIVPDAAARVAAVNFLLGTGLFKALKDAKGAMVYRVVTKQELDVKKDMSGEESMVLSHIQASGNEGIWTKHLKAKTELHQTVIDRCLKSLVQKKLIKAEKSVKYPTRKIYMLFHLEPSVEMTGGPWYTDNELDTEFIKLLCSACLRFIRDRSLPKEKSSESAAENAKQLYPISAAPAYPTAKQVLVFLSKSRITETQLSVEHVEMLLNVLVLDGEIEQVPAFGAALWEANAADGADGSDDERDGKKRDTRKRKRRRDRDSDDDSDDDSSPERKSKKKRKRSKDSEADDDGSEREAERKKKKKTKSRAAADDSDEDRSASESERARRKKKKGKKRKHDSSEDESETAPSDSDSDAHRRHRKRKSKSRQRSSSPAANFGAGGSAAAAAEEDYGAHVYRAVRQEKIAFGLSQAPCVQCPAFEFCKPKGPVNPQDCVYYGEWLVAAATERE